MASNLSIRSKFPLRISRLFNVLFDWFSFNYDSFELKEEVTV